VNQSLYVIPVLNLLIALIPLGIVIGIYFRWSLKGGSLLYATARMLVQLTAVGFVLTFIFEAKNILLICLVLTVMLLVASWIALTPVKVSRKKTYAKAFAALFTGCVPTLLLIIFFVIRLEPWYDATYLIPLAGMIFSNAMNAISLAAERFQSEMERSNNFTEVRNKAFVTSLIPSINMFLAVGIVSLPGMMTGQILAGVDPLVAVRYQIMVMAMLLGSSGISSAVYLSVLRPKVASP